MSKIFIILYFAIGLIICYLGVSAIEDEQKAVNPISFCVAQIIFILFWPICLLMILGGNDDED